MTDSTIMKLSRNGQVSLPAAVRRRWGSDRILVVDLGDRVVMRPADGPPRALRGKYAPAAVSTDELRRGSRDEEEGTDRRRRPA